MSSWIDVPGKPSQLIATRNTWYSMIHRCDNNPYYVRRKIIVCDRWKDAFEDFLFDVRLKPSRQHSLDRINNDANYEPGNVRWATAIQQARNTTKNRYVTFDGETKLGIEWDELMNFPRGTINGRIKRGWTIEEAINSPLYGRFGRFTANRPVSP